MAALEPAKETEEAFAPCDALESGGEPVVIRDDVEGRADAGAEADPSPDGRGIRGVLIG